MEIFRKLNEEREMTIAFVTHEHDVAAYTRRIVSLRDGRIVSDEPNVPVYERPKEALPVAPPPILVQPAPDTVSLRKLLEPIE